MKRQITNPLILLTLQLASFADPPQQILISTMILIPSVTTIK